MDKTIAYIAIDEFGFASQVYESLTMAIAAYILRQRMSGRKETLYKLVPIEHPSIKEATGHQSVFRNRPS